jgi:purine nucleosidase
MPGGPLHDPTVIAYLLEPEIFTGKEVHVHVETAPGATQGMTVFDWWGVTPETPNATVMMDIDADRFFDLLVERIGRL